MFRQLPLFALVLLASLNCLNAQDPVFSQFYSAPLQLNPAFAGITFAPRITANYRNQWPSISNAYRTYAVSYEQAIENLNSGFGLVVMTDDAGDGIYQTSRVHAIYGYQVRMSRDMGLKFGIEAGMIQSRLDWDKLVFVDQLDPLTGPVDGAGNPNESSELQPENLTGTRLDISAGILAYMKNMYAGLSIKHLNTPDESFLDINDNLNVGLPMRFTLHGGAQISLIPGNNRRKASFISPNVMYIRQGDFSQLNLGAYAGFGRVFAGLWYRHTFTNADAAIAMVGFKEGVFRIGYSYDYTLSRLATFGSGGAHEISLTINFEDSYEVQRERNAVQMLDCFRMFN